jgi:hypothetical protein
VNGLSQYSPIGFLLAASPPSSPAAPKFVAATLTTITLQLENSLDNGGAPITAYQLWIDDGLKGIFT